MIFTPTELPGVVVVDIERRTDDRGFFARAWCQDEFAAAGVPLQPVQSSISWNEHRHTLRGMHWQAEPHGETKLVRCTAGAVLDVAVDVRPDSPTYLQHVAVELSAENRRALLIPPCVAHGFLTLTGGAEIHYQMDAPHSPDAARGARYDDPAFAIDWPAAPAVISDRDRHYPDYEV